MLSHGLYAKETFKLDKMYEEIMLDVSEIVCKICQTEFKSCNDVVDHLMTIHSKAFDKDVAIQFQEYRLVDLKCLICHQQFSSFSVLASHVHIDHLKDCFVCNECGRWFKTAAKMELHLSTHEADKVSCDRCDKNFANEAHLKKHHMRVHSHQCPHCDARFKYESVLKKHVAKAHSGNKSGKTLKCEYCFKILPSPMALEVHSNRCKNKQNKIEKYNDETPTKNPKRNPFCNQIRRNIQYVLNTSTAVPFKFKGKFTCFYCPQGYSVFDELIWHTKVQHPICDLKSQAIKMCKGEKTRVKMDVNGLACKICDKSMLDLNSFIDHAIAEHEADYDKSVPLKVCFEAFHIIQGRIPCPECEEPFTYFATLLKHLGAEHNHYKTVCVYCGRGFRSSTSLSMHINNAHTGMCSCSICDAQCNNSSALARHMARFHDAKDFKCPQCPETFESVYKKQIHLIKFHNVGHKCAYCEKMFTRNSFMVNHVRRTHLKERTVPCSVCNLKFFDVHHMRLHMVKHDGVRKFECDICGKSFLRSKNLKSHMDTHKKSTVQEIN